MAEHLPQPVLGLDLRVILWGYHKHLDYCSATDG
jgi:hypothetical protein